MPMLTLVMGTDAIHPDFAQEQIKDYLNSNKAKRKKRSRRRKVRKMIEDAIRSCVTYHR